MKCHYCSKKCEDFVFQEGKLLVVAHRECAEEKVVKDGTLK